MATLTEALGAQSIPQIDAGTKTMEGMKTAMNLAEQAQGLEANKVKVAEMKEQMETAQYNKALNSLHTLARTRPDIAKRMVGKVKENLNKAGIAIDDSVLEVMASDDSYKQRMLSAYSALSGKATNPEARSKGLQALSDYGMFDKAFETILSSEQFDERLKSQEKIASSKAEADLAKSQAKLAAAEDRAAKADARANYGMGKDVSQALFAAKKNFDQKIKEDLASRASAIEAESLLSAGGAISDEAAKSKVARMFEKGVLTDEDLGRLAGSKALYERGKQFVQSMMSGKLSDENRADLYNIVKTLKPLLDEKIMETAKNEARSMKSIYRELGIPEERFTEAFDVSSLLKDKTAKRPMNDKEKIAEAFKRGATQEQIEGKLNRKLTADELKLKGTTGGM